MNDAKVKKPSRKKIILRGLAVLLALFLFFCWLTMGWVPVVGNIVSTAVLSAYARATYPETYPVTSFSGYGFPNDDYIYAVRRDVEYGTLGRDYEDITLEYDLRHGRIRDSELDKKLYEQVGPELDAVNDSMRTAIFDGVILSYYVSVWDFETVRAHLRVDTVNSDKVNVPAETEISAEMAKRGMKAYNTLSPLCNITDFSAHYTSAAANVGEVGKVWWSIPRLELADGQPLTEELIQSAPLTFD